MAAGNMNFTAFDEDGAFNGDGCWDKKKNGNNDRGFRNRQYNNAYGNYRGGYGPAPFGPGPGIPPPLMGPPQMGMFPRGPPPPMGPIIMGRGFGSGPGPRGPRGDPPAVRYLMRCGIPRNEIKKLRNDILDLIEPQYCGLCGHSFDSFSLSRVHYNSKNHQKAVKKYLAQNGNMSCHNPQEAPLRARELYCEICDVQITSKVHADSHYKGKSHAAVVEGRKNPKNPVLLQPGMERRLHQLIRREKKFLNKITEVTEEEKEDKKDIKPLQPELYCDICKTNVTCSDQMTAHLNGKKHLAKEKNYILKSMTGDVKVSIKEEPETGDGDGDNNMEGVTEAATPAEEEWHDNWE